ncbi:MAG: phytoene desaturase family protein [Elusimicrobiota bacterium]
MIIGAGVGGLACGIRLRLLGYDVSILEKNEEPGGRCGRLKLDGYTFDTGPTLLMIPETLESLFRDAGRRLADYISLQRLDPAYRVTFSDGETFNFFGEPARAEEEARRFGAKETEGFRRLMTQSEELYRTSFERFIDRPLENAADWANARTLLYILKTRPWTSVAGVMRRHFRSAHLRMAMSFQTLYLGISPLDCPSIYSMLSYIDLVGGVHYPRGGMYGIVEGLSRLFLELGGTLRCGVEAERILAEDGRVTGVLLHDERVWPADVIVSNVDLAQTHERLLKDERPGWRSRRLLSMKKGCSAAVFLFGVNRTYPDLPHHNIYLPMAYERCLRELFEEGRVPEEPAFYLCAPSRTDPATAPEGGESLMVLVPVPNRAAHKGSHDPAGLRKKILAILNRTLLPGVEEHIVIEKNLPPDWYAERYGLADASTFGFSPTFFQSAMFRPQRRSPDLRGLYFAGASTHPGNGVPIVLIAARLAAEAVAKDYGIPRAPAPRLDPVAG